MHIRKINILLFSLIFFLSLKIYAGNNPLQESNTFIRAGKFKEAIDLINSIPQGQMSKELLLILGLSYEGLGENYKALNTYNKIIEKHPRYTGAYMVRGKLYLKMDYFFNALSDFNTAISLSPDFADCYYYRGRYFWSQGRDLDASIDFEKAIEIDSNHYNALLYKGKILSKQRKFDESIISFSRAIRIKHNSPLLFFLRGNSYSELDNLESALKDYTRVIDLNPDYLKAYLKRGIIYKKLKKYKLAESDLNVFLAKEENKDAYFNRAYSLREQGNYKGALKDINSALKIDTGNYSLYHERGALFFLFGEHEKSIKDYNRAIEINPDIPKIYEDRGLTYALMEENEKAIKDFRTAFKLNPSSLFSKTAIEHFHEYKNFNFLHNKYRFNKHHAVEKNNTEAEKFLNEGNMYSISSDFVSAIQSYSKAIELNPRLSIAYYNRGSAFLNLSKIGEAINDFNKALDIEPEKVKYLNKLSIVHSINKDFRKAIDLALKANGIKETKNSLETLGFAYVGDKQFDKAIKVYNQITVNYSSSVVEYQEKMKDKGYFSQVDGKLSEKFEEALENYVNKGNHF